MPRFSRPMIFDDSYHVNIAMIGVYTCAFSEMKARFMPRRDDVPTNYEIEAYVDSTANRESQPTIGPVIILLSTLTFADSNTFFVPK